MNPAVRFTEASIHSIPPHGMREDPHASGSQTTDIEWGQSTPIPISNPGWADDTDQLPGRISARGKRGVNALSECGRIGVVAGADDDSGMSSLGFAMEADEIEAVQGENSPVLLVRVGQDLIVRNLLIRPSGFVGGEDIMAKPPEFLDDPFREVLVGIERGRQAC
jgi:hypothetical protein